jgi:hypothetical protein
VRLKPTSSRLCAALIAALFIAFAAGTPVFGQASTTTNETMNDSEGAQSEATIISTVKLISQGSATNYLLRLVFHVTVNANGQTTSTVTESQIECRGSK